MDKINVKIKKLDRMVTIPQYQTAGSAGFDLASAQSVTIYPNTQQLISTGLCFELPEGYELQIRSRSGLSLRNRITVANQPATIDSDYRGSVGVIIRNDSDENFTINIGDRIAQGIINQVSRAEFVETNDLDKTTRGSGGFGSTGTK